MKNVIWTVGSDQIEAIQNSWRTDFFREKARHDPWLSGVLKRVSARPHAMAMQTHEIERLHFSTFWNIWIFHEHENPYIFDLGVLHEILHTLAFQKKRVWATTSEQWAMDPLSIMEKAVSLRTEVGVYMRWPELRTNSFEGPIWADRVAAKTWFQIKNERQRLLTAGKSGLTFEDPEEARIAKYATMNARWGRAWSEQGPKIEHIWERAYTSTLQDEMHLFESLWSTDVHEGVPYFALAERFGKRLKKSSPL